VTLAKASLQQLTAGAAPSTTGTAVPVQFNPTTLKLTMTNSIDGGKSRARQVQQYTGTSSTTLGLDLVFDTADEGSTTEAIDVRSKTKEVVRFVLPSGSQNKKAPPRVRFAWGKFVFDGIMSQATEDLDLFSDTGVPLRAKVTISIREQDPKFEALQAGPGAPVAGEGTGAASNPTDQPPPGAPGGQGSGPTDRTAPAIGGESAADFAARNGLDPAAWRGVAAGLDNPLSLPAGLDISFNSGLSAGAGLGVTLGVGVSAGAGISAGVDASLGLQADVSLGASASVSAATRASPA